jgi:hypothetical protein
MTSKNAITVGVAMVVPLRFVSYSRVSSLDIFGIVMMILVGGWQRLGDQVHVASPHAPFKLTIEVECEAEGTPHVESTVFFGSIAKALGTSLSIVLSAILLLAVHA